MEKWRIVLADDHPLMLIGIKELLGRDFSMHVDALLHSSTDLVEHLESHKVDVVVTDYSMPGDQRYGDGLKLIKYLLRHFANVRVVVLTMVSNPMIISALYEAGVSAVVLKRDSMEEILVALGTVRSGRKYYPANFHADAGPNQRERFLNERINSLSPREFEVLRLFARGESIAQIAAGLKRSIKTVSCQKSAAMRKLQVETNQDLIAFCVAHGLFD